MIERIKLLDEFCAKKTCEHRSAYILIMISLITWGFLIDQNHFLFKTFLSNNFKCFLCIGLRV